MSATSQQQQQQQATPEAMTLCLLGSHSVGKTTITMQFVYNMFVDVHDLTIEDAYRKKFTVDEKCYLLDFFESTVPDEYTEGITDQNIRRSQCILLVFAFNDRSSFAGISKLFQRVLYVKDQDTFPMIMVGNKTDLKEERVIDSKEARDLARELRIDYVECTAKKSVDHIFRQSISCVKNYKPFVEYENDSRKCTIV